MHQGTEGLGETLERLRPYALFLARAHLKPWLHAKVSAESVVQETFGVAVAKWPQCGPGDDERKAWLKQILLYKIMEKEEYWGAQCRDPAREVALRAEIESASAFLEESLAARDPSPSELATREERLQALRGAVTQLPEQQLHVITLHFVKGYTQVQIAGEMGITRGAVAGLLHRGLKTLRTNLENRESAS